LENLSVCYLLKQKMLFQENWERIKNKSIFDLILLEAHNACSFNVNANLKIVCDQKWIEHLNNIPPILRQLTGIKRICNDFAKTQNRSLVDLLKTSGVRSLDIRIAIIDNVPWVHHTFLISPLSLVLEQLTTFLQENPFEFVQVKLKWTDVPQTVYDDGAITGYIDGSMSSLCKEMCANRDEYLFTLEQLKNVDKRLFIFIDKQTNTTTTADKTKQVSILTPWSCGFINEFKDRYNDTNDAALLIDKINKDVDKLNINHKYCIRYTLTPQSDDYVKHIVACCGLSKKNLTLSDLNSSLPNIFSPGQINWTNWKKACNLSMDFIPSSDYISQIILCKKIILDE